jgi:hypothetical protein
VPEFLQEVTKFNQECETAYCQYSFQKLKLYSQQMNIPTKDVIYYSQRCHCCGFINRQLTAEEFEPYCSERCRAAIEDDGDFCYYKDHYKPCLICDNSGREYDDESATPSFITAIKNKCYSCLNDFAYPPFEYYSNDYIYIYDGLYQHTDIQSCHDCFCKNSTRLTQFGQNYPIKNLRSHHPVISAISMFKDFQIYNLVDDQQVWTDLFQYME